MIFNLILTQNMDKYDLPLTRDDDGWAQWTLDITGPITDGIPALSQQLHRMFRSQSHRQDQMENHPPRCEKF